MNHADGWMNGGGTSSSGMWIWVVLGVAVVILLAVIVGKLSQK